METTDTAPAQHGTNVSQSTIVLCMGSSCFSRGNGENLPLIQQFIADHNLKARVRLKGCRCGGCCASGPNAWINGELRTGMTGAKLDVFLRSLLTFPS